MNDSTSMSDWKPCPEGTLVNVPKQLQQLDRRRWMISAGTTTAGFIVSVAGVSFLLLRSKTSLDCPEVFALSNDYFEHRLTPEQVNSIESHLVSCKKCRGYYDRLRTQLT